MTPPALGLKRLSFAVVAAASLAVGGCDRLGRGEPTVEEIVQKIVEAQSADGGTRVIAETTVTATGPVPLAGMRIESETWSLGPTKVRTEYVIHFTGDLGGADMSSVLSQVLGDDEVRGVALRNGDRAWVYIGMMDAYYKIDTSQWPASTGPEQLATFLPGLIGELGSSYDVAVVGREDVAGVTTFKLRATPQSGADTPSLFGAAVPPLSELMLWIDPKGWLVRKATLTLADGGQEGARVEITTVAQTIEENVEIPEGMFTFTPPEGAVEIDASDVPRLRAALSPAAPGSEGGGGMSVTSLRSFAEAERHVDFPIVAVRGLPEGCQETTAQIVPLIRLDDDEGTAVTVIFSCPQGTIMISQAPAGNDIFRVIGGEPGATREVTVPGASGPAALVVFDGGQRHMLEWDTPTTRVQVDAEWPADAVVRLAELMMSQ